MLEDCARDVQTTIIKADRADPNFVDPERVPNSRPTLLEGLSHATCKIRVNARKQGLATSVETLSISSAATGLCVAFAVVLSRLFLLPVMTLWIVAAVGIGVAIFTCAWQILLKLSSQPDEYSVAERLDLVCGNQNAIATALDLIRAKNTCPMALCAIAQGITSVKKLGDIDPVLSHASLPWRRLWGRTAIGAAAVAAAIIIPIHPIFSATEHKFLDQRPGRTATLLTLNDSKPDVESKTPEPPGVTTQPERSAGHSGVSPRVSNQTPPAGSEPAPSSNGSGDASAESQSVIANSSMNKRGNGERKKSTAKDPSADSVSHPGKPGGHAVHSSSAGDVGADAAHAAGTADGGSINDTPPEDDTQKNNESGMKQGGSGGSDGKSPAEKSNEQSGEGGSGQGGKPSTAHNHSQQSGDEVGGNGQGGGQNPPKKSRGVAPLMLGMRQPDVLRGRPLPGPDERTKLQVPPVADPDAPTPSVSAAPRITDEPVVPQYRVPADMTGIVGDYFDQFHQEKDATKTAP